MLRARPDTKVAFATAHTVCGCSCPRSEQAFECLDIRTDQARQFFVASMMATDVEWSWRFLRHDWTRWTHSHVGVLAHKASKSKLYSMEDFDLQK